MDCYVYYKASVSDEQEIIACFQRLRHSLEKLGLAPVLQRRPESKNSMHTWMETYTEIPNDFDVIIGSCVIASGLMNFVIGDRHAERFIRI